MRLAVRCECSEEDHAWLDLRFDALVFAMATGGLRGVRVAQRWYVGCGYMHARSRFGM